MKLYMSDVYRVELLYPNDETSLDILYYLYQPIIKSRALQLYMTMNTESKRMASYLKPAPLSRLVSFLSISLLDIEKDLKTLEAIGLLKTYVKHHDHLTYYVFQLQNPYSLQKFFHNQILVSLLQDSLSKDDYYLTMKYFEPTLTSLDGFEEVTALFQDVFSVTYHQCENGHHLELSLKEKKDNDIHVEYDLEMLKNSLSDYQVNRQLLTDDDYTFISQLGIVYSIDARTYASMIKEAMKSTGLDRALLKQKLKGYFEMDQVSELQEIHHKQPLAYKTTNGETSPLALHMKYLDSITPYELLKAKQGGKEPIYNDLKIVETLMVQLGLKPAVVNVLIEYVLGKNDNRLSKNYIESIAASWTRKHIDTAMDAYYELTGKEKDEQEEVEVKVQKAEPIVETSSQLDELLKELQEGKL